ncbi:IclR family transcriptional regulator [Streptomyces tsukubensis]|uniref:IclR family transcriptional regulator n=1 Tax=Streptomyces tsukubensis TaxID=83656 RepID=UPI0015C2F697|nr:IclR family transcriptional regulator [Streptomyces tsukubensis]
MSGSNSVAKALRVLDALAQPDAPHRLGEIAERSGVPKASAHRILGTLVAEGYAVPDGEGRYGIGGSLQAMAARVLSEDTVGIGAVLRTLQQRLGQTVHLAVLNGDHATYTHKVDPDRAYRIATEVGMRLPLHATAAGKALLAHLPAEEASALLDTVALTARTARTVTGRAELDHELRGVRADGFAVDYEEHEQSICSLAAPVLDSGGYPVGAVSVSALTFLVTREQLPSFADAVRQAAADVARRL